MRQELASPAEQLGVRPRSPRGRVNAGAEDGPAVCVGAIPASSLRIRSLLSTVQPRLSATVLGQRRLAGAGEPPTRTSATTPARRCWSVRSASCRASRPGRRRALARLDAGDLRSGRRRDRRRSGARARRAACRRQTRVPAQRTAGPARPHRAAPGPSPGRLRRRGRPASGAGRRSPGSPGSAARRPGSRCRRRADRHVRPRCGRRGSLACSSASRPARYWRH